MTDRRSRLKRLVARGFTLVELLVVVVIVGVLAVVGITLFRKHINSSKTVEASSEIQSIRAAEERWRAENQSYLNVSSSGTAWFPNPPTGQKRGWYSNTTHTDYARWKLLNVTVGSPVLQFGYTVRAGISGQAMAAPQGLTAGPTLPSNPVDPWYVIQAKADVDGDGVAAHFLATSLNGELYSENEGE